MLSQSLTLNQKQTQKISLKQKLEQRQWQLPAIRLALLQVLRGIEYKPEGQCPTCRRELKLHEIIAGFNNDPHDFNTTCTGCGTRFTPELKYVTELGSKMTIPFFCNIQSLEMLKKLSGEKPADIALENPGAYHSAIIHYGSLSKAFAKINVRYVFDEVENWKTKVRPFLGRLPDIDIAKYVNVSASTVGSLRRGLKIKSYERGVEDEK